MNEQMTLLILALLMVALVLLAIALFRLSRQIDRIRQSQEGVQKQLLRHDADLAGLCSAAIAVDRRLEDSESQHSRFMQALKSQQQVSDSLPEPPAQAEPQLEGYARAIQMIIRGASAEELVKSCGMTHDEAMLLISVNRSNEINKPG